MTRHDIRSGAPTPSARKGLTVPIGRASLILWLERLWPLVAGVFCILAAFGILGLLALPQSLPDAWHALLLGCMWGGCFFLVYKGAKDISAPSDAEVSQRIETASGLRHHPLQTLADQRAAGSEAIWKAHLERAHTEADTLKVGFPHLITSSPYITFLSAGLGGVFLVLACLNGPDLPARLLSAFWPGIDDPSFPRARVQAWVTLPAYAGSTAIFLSGNDPRVPPVPAGAALDLRVMGAHGRPRLHTRAGSVVDTLFHKTGAASWTLSAPVTKSDTLTLRVRGRTIAAWDIKVEPPSAPFVVWNKTPWSLKDERYIHFSYRAGQKFGLKAVNLKISLTDAALNGLKNQGIIDHPLRLSLPLTGHPREIKSAFQKDFSALPWAGLEAVATLEVIDVTGQRASASSQLFTLPKRQFHTPIAVTIIDLRRRLALRQETPHQVAQDIIALVQGLALKPDTFLSSAGVFLNLQTVAALLKEKYSPPDGMLHEALARMWSIALDIEERRASDPQNAQASVEVRAAQEAVNAQIERMQQLGKDGQHGAEQEELKRRMDVLRKAITHKMQALARKALQDKTALPLLPQMMHAGHKSYDRLIKQIEADMQAGHPERALNKLQQMRDMLERMRNATEQDIKAIANQLKAQRQFKELQQAQDDIMRQQSALLDSSMRRQATFDDLDTERNRLDNALATLPPQQLVKRFGRHLPALESSDSNYKKEHASQQALARATAALRDDMRDIGGADNPSLKEAQSLMQEAAKALKKHDDTNARKAQKGALLALQKGGQQMRKSLRNNQASALLPMFGLTPMPGRGGDGLTGRPDTSSSQDSKEGGKNSDPLGRHIDSDSDDPSGNASGNIPIPDALSRQKSREIEEEIRRRESDRTRSHDELEYLRRLLKAF